MFGLILAVGMLVDGAIVVVEYADKRIREGSGPMHAYVEAAKRMFWPIISSTATTLCAFLPMLFWPGVPGQFMRMLPVTLIFVLSASLLVALVYLPVVGGVTGRTERWFNERIEQIATTNWYWHLLLFPLAIAVLLVAASVVPLLLESVGEQFAGMDGGRILGSVVPTLILCFAMLVCVMGFAVAGLAAVVAALLGLLGSVRRAGDALNRLRERHFPHRRDQVKAGYRRTPFGWFIHLIAANPIAPLLSFCAIFVLVGSVMMYFINNNRGVEFFVDSQPENALVYVKARGNLSLDQKDALVDQAEKIVMAHPNIKSAFAFAGDGGLNNNTGGAEAPLDTVGQIQIELYPWEERPTAYETWFTIPLLVLTWIARSPVPKPTATRPSTSLPRS